MTSPEPAEPRQDGTPEALIGTRVLDAWVPTAVAATGTACHVLRARPVEGQSKVMVHVIRLPDTVDADKIRSELEFRRRIRHDGVLQLLTSGAMEDGRVVLVTPDTGGTTLASRIAMRPPRLPGALRIAAQVARALRAIHDVSGVYGPITPEHILVEPDADGREHATVLPVWWAWRHGHDATTASPWQPILLEGEPRRMADDAYALGAILWNTITGFPPRDEDALDTLTGASSPMTPPSLSSQVRRSLPASLDAIVAALLAPEREDRPSDLSAIADRLEDVVHQLEGGGSPPIAPPMVMATPIPVGGQLRDRSLLPFAPPDRAEVDEDAPTAPSETRALSGVHLPMARSATPASARERAPDAASPPVRPRPAPPGQGALDVRPSAQRSLEDAPTLIDEADTPTPPPSESEPPARAAAPADTPLFPDEEATGAPLWIWLTGAASVVFVSIVAALYLAGLLG